MMCFWVEEFMAEGLGIVFFYLNLVCLYLICLLTSMAAKQRFLSLDVFRGATVFLMIVVNNPSQWGVQYGPLQHAAWHGFTLTDLVFPSFLFAVGNAMAFVMGRYEGQGEGYFWKKVLKRSLMIFLIGLGLNWFPFYDFGSGEFISFSTLRIFGVLQRIAFCYFIAAIIIHYLKTNRLIIYTSLLLLFGYWFVVWIFGKGDPYSISGFVGNQWDLAIVGPNHVYQGEGMPFDPEGFLSTLPSVVNVLIGYLVGLYFTRRGVSYEVLAKLLVAGALLILAGLTWDLFFPINKKIWTSSFVLLTSGICMSALAILAYLIELKKSQSWTHFFVVFGKNPLFIYAFSWVLAVLFWMVQLGGKSIQSWIYDSYNLMMSEALASLFYAITFTMINWIIGFYLDQKKVYIRV